jgi:isopenicillin-N N-acyltransferase like protein
LEKYNGLSSSAHILVADASNGVGMEFSAFEVQKLLPDKYQRIYHSNHYLVEHPGVEELAFLDDSGFRADRIRQLTANIDKPTLSTLQALYKDQENSPGAICRVSQGSVVTSTLFNIVMDLTDKVARVTMGPPTKPTGTVLLSFDK